VAILLIISIHICIFWPTDIILFTTQEEGAAIRLLSHVLSADVYLLLPAEAVKRSKVNTGGKYSEVVINN
jgi:hypothetical protein